MTTAFDDFTAWIQPGNLPSEFHPVMFSEYGISFYDDTTADNSEPRVIDSVTVLGEVTENIQTPSRKKRKAKKMGGALSNVREDEQRLDPSATKRVKATAANNSSSHKFPKETNMTCKNILNHRDLTASTLPENLQCFKKFNGTILYFLFSHKQIITMTFIYIHTDGLDNHDLNSTGYWFFEREYGPLKNGNDDVILSDGQVAEWDPNYPLGLVIVMPSGVHTSHGETIEHEKMMHFGGRFHLLMNTKVVIRYFSKELTDKRIIARCYFRVRARVEAAPEGAPAQRLAPNTPTSVAEAPMDFPLVGLL